MVLVSLFELIFYSINESIGVEKFKAVDIIKSIDIGDLVVFENLIRDFKLLPVPEINTAVLVLL